MARQREERRWQLLRRSVLFWLGIAIVVVALSLYFVVDPLLAFATGRHLELPEVKLMIVIVSTLAAPLLGINPRYFAETLLLALAKLPDDAKKGGDDAGAE